MKAPRTREQALVLADRCAAALAEMGYQRPVTLEVAALDGSYQPAFNTDGLPAAVAWQTLRLATADEDVSYLPCWSCWHHSPTGSPGASEACWRGNCAHPEGPAKPPRELLIARAS